MDCVAPFSNPSVTSRCGSPLLLLTAALLMTSSHKGDNSVAIKSGMDKSGRFLDMPSYNQVYRRSTFVSETFAIGSEMSGGQQITVTWLVFTTTKCVEYTCIDADMHHHSSRRGAWCIATLTRAYKTGLHKRC